MKKENEMKKKCVPSSMSGNSPFTAVTIGLKLSFNPTKNVHYDSL